MTKTSDEETPRTHDRPSAVVAPAEPAHHALECALRRVEELLRKLDARRKGEPGSGAGQARARRRLVHELRVATRRASAACEVAGSLDARVDSGAGTGAGSKRQSWARKEGGDVAAERAEKLRKVRRQLRRIRRGAGSVRDADVMLRVLRVIEREAVPSTKANTQAGSEPNRESGRKPGNDPTTDARMERHHLATELRRGRAEALQELLDEASGRAGKLRKARREFSRWREETDSNSPEETWVRGVQAVLAQHLVALDEAGSADLRVLDNMHALRLAAKRVRYTVELLPGSAQSEAGRVIKAMRELQQSLGELNDVAQFAAFLAVRAGAVGADPLPALQARVTAEVACRLALAQEAWARFSESEVLPIVHELAQPSCGAEQAAAVAGSPVAPCVGVDTVGLDLILEAAAAARVGGVHGPVMQREGSPSAVMPTQLPIVVVAGRGASLRPRLAAIDIGSNSVRLIVAELHPGDAPSYRVLDDEKEMTRLGRGLHARGGKSHLDQHSMALTIQIIGRMKGIAEGYGARLIRVVATCAVREADNGPEFIAAVKAATGLDVQTISAEAEAMLAYRSAARAFDLSAVPAAVMDVGGGSTEIVLSAPAVARHDTDQTYDHAAGGIVDRVYTIGLGAVRVTQRFGGPEGLERRFKEARRWVCGEIERGIGAAGLPFIPALLIGTGGTLTTLGCMVAHQEMGPAVEGLFAGAVQGLEIKRSQVMHVMDMVRATPVKDRGKLPGLSPDRADIMLAGLLIMERAMKVLGVNTVRVHEGGIRDGVLLEMAEGVVASVSQFGASLGGGIEGSWSSADGAGGQAASFVLNGNENGNGLGLRRRGGVDPLAGVRRLARACGYEAAHSRHVAALSLELFDALLDWSATSGRESLRALLTPRARVLLESAAILHDIGYLVNYAAHHKHSYHLIVHADLPGFTTEEIGVIANVARYHRLAEPKKKHSNFTRLPVGARRQVRVLAGILRVCDGLDRTHTQRITGVTLRMPACSGAMSRSARRDEPGCLQVLARAEAEPSVDQWGAQRKSRLLAKVLKQSIEVGWLEADPAKARGLVHEKHQTEQEPGNLVGAR